MLQRENLLKALQREKPRSISFSARPATAIEYLFICRFSDAVEEQKREQDLVQKMAEALKLEKSLWEVLALKENDLASLREQTSDKNVKRIILLVDWTEEVKLAGAFLVQGASPSSLLKNINQKKILWEKLKSLQTL